MTKIVAYRCDKCGRLYEDKSEYIDHLKDHVKDKLKKKFMNSCAKEVDKNLRQLYDTALKSPRDVIGLNCERLLAGLYKKEKKSCNNVIDLMQRFKQAKVDKIDIKKTYGNIYLIIRISSAAAARFKSCNRIINDRTVTIQNEGNNSWSSYYNSKDKLCITFNYGLAEDNPDLNQIWIKLRTKAKLKTDAVKYTRNTFRIT